MDLLAFYIAEYSVSQDNSSISFLLTFVDIFSIFQLMKKIALPLAIIFFIAVFTVLFFLIPSKETWFSILIPSSIIYFLLSFLLIEHFDIKMRSRAEQEETETEEEKETEEEEEGAPKVSKTLRKFFDAAKQGNLRVVEKLLQKGVDIESHDEGRGYTALMHAANAGKIEVVQFLLDKGADVNGKGTDLGRSALMLAAWEGHTEVAQLLINKGAKVNKQRSDKVHALYVAAQNDHLDTVDLLLKYCTEIDMGGLKDNATALMIACQRGNTKIVEFLVKRGANVNAQTVLDGHGYSPLVLAAEFGFYEIVKILIEAGAKIDVRNGELAHTALMVAAQNEHIEVIRYLIEKGADATIRTKDGASTVSFAPHPDSGNEKASEILNMLKKASAQKRKFKLT